MKKSLLALAVMGAFAGAAQAQSSITIYGAIDGGLRHVDNVNAAGDSKTTLGSLGTYNQNRIGFRGVEDLGGGMSARFVLETGFNTGTGAIDTNPTLTATTGGATRLFQRTATVGLMTPIGGIDFGRQYSVAFKAIAAYEPLGYKYVAIAPTAAAAAGSTGNALFLGETNTSGPLYGAQGGARFDNDIQFSTRLGPVTLLAEYALGETTGSTSDGAAAAIGANYAAGPFTIGGAYTSKKNNVATAHNLVRASLGLPGTAAATYEDNDQWTIGAAFKAGPLRVTAGYINDEQDGTFTVNPLTGAPLPLDETQVRNAWVGVNYAISPALELTGAFYKTKREATTTLGTTATDGTRDLLIVGMTYALSKRTNLYAEVDTAKLKGDFRMISGGRTEDRQTGVSVGLNHLF